MKHILLVEDKESIREMLRDALNDQGHKVTLAEDGHEALKHINENPDRNFDIIISDIIMPKVDGIEFVTGLRAVNNQTPVLFISGGGYNMNAAQVLENSNTLANATLQKPFTNDDLMKAINKLTA